MASVDVCETLPKTTWSTSFGSTLERSSAALAATTPRSVAVKSLSEPPNEPKGVRAPSRNTMCPLELTGVNLELYNRRVFAKQGAASPWLILAHSETPGGPSMRKLATHVT